MNRVMPAFVAVSITAVVLAGAAPSGAATAEGSASTSMAAPSAVAYDTSPPLRDMPILGPTPKTPKDPKRDSMPPARKAALIAHGPAASSLAPQLDAQGDLNNGAPPAMPAPIQNFAGMDNPNGYYPPDTVGDVSLTHYVQMVNASFAIYQKDGTQLFGPADFNTLFGGFGGDCQNYNDGDPIVVYDGLADRWVLSQFAISGAETFECVAVSATSDPLGAYHRYAFSYGTLFPDYPKIGVWPDGYYVTYNIFNDVGFGGTLICALDRAAMLQGAAATQQCADLLPTEWSLLPSDVDGPTAPPEGSPNYLLGEHWDDPALLTMYQANADWSLAAGSRLPLTGPIQIPVPAYTWACVDVNRGRCVPQPDTAVLLESLGGKMMHRLAYRNFGTHESLVTNHTVAMDGNIGLTAQTGVGWFEVRLENQQPVLHQSGTSASTTPGIFNWMGSAAMDRQGNMALGYSSSGTALYPSINYIGRLADDPLGTTPFTEGLIMAGAGSQTGTSARWGDYSAMQVDPEDDCTFWYTTEYMKATSPKNWSTQIASFKYPGCTGTTSVPGAPASVTGVPGNSAVSVTWPATADNGGLPVLGYDVTMSPGSATCTTQVGVTVNPLACTFDNLTNGTAYTFTVRARNAKGVSADVTSSPVTPAAVPTAPRQVTAEAGSWQATVSWLAPVSDGGSAVTSYTVTATPGGATCTTPVGAAPVPTSCVVGGLLNGSTYTFTVVSTNAMGDSLASSPSAPVTPVEPPAPGPGPAPTATPEPTPTPTTGTRPPPGPQPDPGPAEPPVAGLVVSTGSSTVFAPRAPIRVTATRGTAGCSVRVTVGRVARTAPVDARGRAVVTLPAPRPNRAYVVLAQQYGTGCTALTGQTSVTVSGPYVTGPRSVSAGAKATFTGRAFRPGRNVTWRVTGPQSIASTVRPTSQRGLSTFAATMPEAGRYTVIAKQGKLRAAYVVVVR